MLLALLPRAFALECDARRAGPAEARSALVERIVGGDEPVDDALLRCLGREGAPSEVIDAVRLRMIDAWIARAGPRGTRAVQVLQGTRSDPAAQIARQLAGELDERDGAAHRHAVGFASTRGADTGWFSAEAVSERLLGSLPGARALGDRTLLGDGAVAFLRDPDDPAMRERLKEGGIDRVVILGASGAVPLAVSWRLLALDDAPERSGTIDFLLMPLDAKPPPLPMSSRLRSPLTLAGTTGLVTGLATVGVVGALWADRDAHDDVHYARLRAVGWVGAGLAVAGGGLVGWRLASGARLSVDGPGLSGSF